MLLQAIAGDFDSSNKSKEQIEAKSVNRKEASVRRERALAYAYSHQVIYIKPKYNLTFLVTFFFCFLNE